MHIFVEDKVLYSMKFKLSMKKRGKRGDGRAVHFKPVQVPEDVFEDLKLYKEMYSIGLATEKDEEGNMIFANVSFGDMLRHWMDNVETFDPEIQGMVDRTREVRSANEIPTYYVDPCEGDIWELGYSFEKDGDELEAVPDEDRLFYAVLDGQQVGMKELDQQGWVLMNEVGIEIDIIEAVKVSKILLAHKK